MAEAKPSNSIVKSLSGERRAEDARPELETCATERPDII
jgi:hypothetical protein